VLRPFAMRKTLMQTSYKCGWYFRRNIEATRYFACSKCQLFQYVAPMLRHTCNQIQCYWNNIQLNFVRSNSDRSNTSLRSNSSPSPGKIPIQYILFYLGSLEHRSLELSNMISGPFGRNIVKITPFRSNTKRQVDMS
jgi:hypothetical protein